MKRRDFLTKAGVGAVAGVTGASALSTPSLAKSKKTITIVSTWPRAVSYTHLTLPTTVIV